MKKSITRITRRVEKKIKKEKRMSKKNKKLTKKNKKGKKQMNLKDTNKNMVGGRSSLGKALRSVKKSEKNLIKYYQKHSSASEKYYTKLDKHISNLKNLDEHIPDVDSFLDIFNNNVLPDEITPNKKINKLTPLFIQAYAITENSSPKEITKEHIKQQIRYVMKKKHAPQDIRLLRDMEIDLEPTFVNLRFVLLDNRITPNYMCPHNKYALDLVKLELNIDAALEMAKGNIDYQETKREKEIKQDVINLYKPNVALAQNVSSFNQPTKPTPEQQTGQTLGQVGDFGIVKKEKTAEDLKAEQDFQQLLEQSSDEIPSNPMLSDEKNEDMS